MTDQAQPILSITIVDEAAMVALGACFAQYLADARRIYLHGDLAAGKTVFVRGLIAGLGYAGAVTSPTFALVEPYDLENRRIFHFDLYRLEDPEELEFMGLRDYLESDDLMLVEWAERGGEFLPPPDVDVIISKRQHERNVQFTANTGAGERLLEQFGRAQEARS